MFVLYLANPFASPEEKHLKKKSITGVFSTKLFNVSVVPDLSPELAGDGHFQENGVC
jgi:hypothetical protein